MNTCPKAIRTAEGNILCKNSGKACERTYFDTLGNRLKLLGTSNCPNLTAAPPAQKKKRTTAKKKV